jgi:hypothetical protein
MAALRKSSIALLLILGIMLGVNVASAQVPSQSLGVVTCQATAVPPVVRAEGIAEIVGDIVLVCQNIPPGAGLGDPTRNRIVTNVSVSLNVNITNNINFGEGSTTSDAVLVINENNCTDPSPLGSVFGDCVTPDLRFQDPQLGTLAASNRLEWNEVDFPVPGGSASGVPVADCSAGGVLFPGDPASGCFPFVTTLRITSMRANASQLGVPDTATFPSTQITAFVSITGPTTIPVTNNVLNVAVPILGLIVTGPGAVTGLQCIDAAAIGSITLREGFATAFKTLGVPTFVPGNTQWESGYYEPESNNGGGATQATRFILRFFNIPQGVELVVPNYVSSATGSPLPSTSDNLELFLVPNAGADGAGGTASLGTTSGSSEITISGGFGQAVYEVHDSDPFLVESVVIPLGVAWEADTTNDLPAIGSGQISVSFAPISTIAVASRPAPEPRFVDTSGDPRTFVSILRCTTTLLFPFVTNQAGFDTGMAISNTSEDWLGTDPQSGACTIHYHGSTTGGGAAPPEQTSTAIGAGEQLIFTLSGGNQAQGIEGGPEFQGYIIAVCDFQYAHGFAFITDGFGGVPALAQGYLALVIPVTPDQGRIAGVPGLHPYGEALSQ